MLKVYQCLRYIDRWWVTITDKASLTTADPETEHRTICKFLNNYIGDSLYTDGPSVLQDWKEVQGQEGWISQPQGGVEGDFQGEMEHQ